MRILSTVPGPNWQINSLMGQILSPQRISLLLIRGVSKSRLYIYFSKNKRPCLPTGPFVLFDAWQFPTLAWGDPTLPSALRRFTSEFGMGSGGTTALLPPDKFFFKCRTLTVLSGADTQSRTGDLTLTKGALYQLSHISTLNLMPGSFCYQTVFTF